MNILSCEKINRLYSRNLQKKPEDNRAKEKQKVKNVAGEREIKKLGIIYSIISCTGCPVEQGRKKTRS